MHKSPLNYDARPGINLTAARRDIVSSLTTWSLWGMMGWFDIRQRYRRSLLGPLWATISLAVFVSSVSLVYGRLLGIAWDEFVLFIAIGLTVWTFMSSVVAESCMAFMVYERLIKEMRMPLSSHVLRIVWRNLLIFFHNLLLYPVLLIYLGRWPGWVELSALGGLLLLLINAVWVSLFLAVTSARFRDLPPIAINLLQVSFFLTPVLWKPNLLAGVTKLLVVDYNPLNAFVEVIRAPLMGHWADPVHFIVIAGFTLFGWAATLMLFACFRARVVYWL